MSEKKGLWRRIREYKVPLSLALLAGVNHMGWLKRAWDFLNIADTLSFVFEAFPILNTFIQSGLSLGLLALAVSWASVKLIQRGRPIYASWGLVVAVILSAYLAFVIGQQVPPPDVLLRYYNPFKQRLDVRNDPLTISIPLETRGLSQYDRSYWVGARCRAVEPGVPMVSAFGQLSRFYPVGEDTTIELLPGDAMTDILCQTRPNSSLECQLMMVRKAVAIEFNREVMEYGRAGGAPPTLDGKVKNDKDFLLPFRLIRRVNVTGCDD